MQRSESSLEIASMADDPLPPGQAAASAEEEAELCLFDATWAAVEQQQTQRRGGGTSFILVATAIFFALSMLWQNLDWKQILLLLGILLLHEAGHYWGMLYFGFRDVRMFFIPFFGGGAMGEKHAAPAWQRGIVSLLGPLPGLALALPLYAWYRQPFTDPAGMAILMLVALNLFNLLPVEPLDGGNLMAEILFKRHPVLELLFILFAVMALTALAGWLGSFILGGLALLMLVSCSHRWRLARIAQRLRKEGTPLASELRDLTEDERWRLYATVRPMVNSTDPSNADLLASLVQQVHEKAVVAPPRWYAAVGLFLLYLLGWVLGIGTVTWMVFDDMHGDDPEARKEYIQLSLEIDKLQGKKAKLKEATNEICQSLLQVPEEADELKAEFQRTEAAIAAVDRQLTQKREQLEEFVVRVDPTEKKLLIRRRLKAP